MSKFIKEYHKMLKAMNLDLDTFFGRIGAFEMILEEEHEKTGDADGGMYRYKGMEQYGNIVSYIPTANALNIIVNEFGWKMEWVDEIYNWYKDRGFPDCVAFRIYVEIWKEKRQKEC